mgnify:CR=1 FL=1
MKKNLILMAFAMMVVAIPFIQGCRKNQKQKNCFYGNNMMVYNPLTNDCECINYYEGMELDTGYNAWDDVVHYMQYFTRSDKPDYPYYSREGDTVKTCGWINHCDGQTLLPNESDSLYVQFEISNDSLTAMNAYLSGPIHIEGDKALFDGIDQDKKCYIKGIITFHSQTDIGWEMGPADPEPSHNCSSAIFALRLVEIRN